MFADNICVFCPSSVHGLQSILDVCQAYAEELHGIIFNSSKTVFITFNFKLSVQKARSSCCWNWMDKV